MNARSIGVLVSRRGFTFDGVDGHTASVVGTDASGRLSLALVGASSSNRGELGWATADLLKRGFIGKHGDGKTLRAESTKSLSNEISIVGNLEVGLKGSIAILGLGGHMKSVEALALNRVEGVAARLKHTVINNCVGSAKLVNLSDLISSTVGIGFEVKSGLAVEALADIGVEVVHHDVYVTLRTLVFIAVVGHVDIPMVGKKVAEDVSSTSEGLTLGAKALFSILNFLSKGRMREHLIFREDEVLARVADPLELHAELLSLFEEKRKASQQRSRSAGLDKGLVTVHK
mmetsp:Transcript_9086/g.17915  ORF Transcript_9086/g.17915 Transcript_9086/m.17915 type:complete len:288 (-) Transcript_9086:1413-2276(-)